MSNSSSSESESSDENTSGDSTTSGETDFSDQASETEHDNPAQLELNLNNGASPSNEDSDVQLNKSQKRKTEKTTPQGGASVPKKARKGKDKLVKMTTTELQELMNTTIANYEKTKGSQLGTSTDQSKSTTSDTTIYSRLCPPGPRNSLNNAVTHHDLPMQMTNINLVEENDLSDESLVVQLNSSDEVGDNSIPGRQLPLPPPPVQQTTEQVPPNVAARAKADDMIKQAELQKAELAKPPGENNLAAQYTVNKIISDDDNVDGSLDYLHNSGTAHVDRQTRLKVKLNEYVDLVKFLPRDLDTVDDDENLVLTSKEGKTYHVPPADRDNAAINTFKKWQTAFKVFMGVYMEEHPDKLNLAPELVQYMQLIEDMTTTWIWDNVYKYDKRHRRMMGQFKKRHWHVPYQAARAELKITHIMNNLNQSNPRYKKPGIPPNKQKKEACRNYN